MTRIAKVNSKKLTAALITAVLSYVQILSQSQLQCMYLKKFKTKLYMKEKKARVFTWIHFRESLVINKNYSSQKLFHCTKTVPTPFKKWRKIIALTFYDFQFLLCQICQFSCIYSHLIKSYEHFVTSTRQFSMFSIFVKTPKYQTAAICDNFLLKYLPLGMQMFILSVYVLRIKEVQPGF